MLGILFRPGCVELLHRFNDSSAYFHDDEREGLARVCRLALHQKYPKFSSDGYEALYSRTPIIYISSAARPGVGQYICAQVGVLQGSCFSPMNRLWYQNGWWDLMWYRSTLEPIMMMSNQVSSAILNNASWLAKTCLKSLLFKEISDDIPSNL